MRPGLYKATSGLSANSKTSRVNRVPSANSKVDSMMNIAKVEEPTSGGRITRNASIRFEQQFAGNHNQP